MLAETEKINNKHLDHDEDRDPHYDYDHSAAHHYSSDYVRRSRTMSVGNLNIIPSSHPPPLASTSIGRMSEESSSSSGNSALLLEDAEKHRRRRRGSHDEVGVKPRKFIIDVQQTLQRIIAQEDTDGDCQITITDSGPKLLTLGTAESHGHNKFELRGTYALANLLQELAVASDHGRKFVVLDEMRLVENPVDRLLRLIKHHFWDGLTRRIDADGLEMICLDPKNRSANKQLRIYVPHDDPRALEYFQQVAREKSFLQLDVVQLPAVISPEYVKSINDKPGILTLALKVSRDLKTGEERLRGVPFVVPGGRFNEMYNWGK